MGLRHDVSDLYTYIYIYMYIYIYKYIYIWAIPPKLAPVSEDTVFALSPNIIKHSYRNHHFG